MYRTTTKICVLFTHSDEYYDFENGPFTVLYWILLYLALGDIEIAGIFNI
jgi:hypothetical protein